MDDKLTFIYIKLKHHGLQQFKKKVSREVLIGNMIDYKCQCQHNIKKKQNGIYRKITPYISILIIPIFYT